MGTFARFIAALILCQSVFAAEQVRTEIGKPIIDLKLNDLQGKVCDTAELRAGKIILICFSSTDDDWSKKQVLHLTRAAEEFGEKIVIVNIATREKLSVTELAEHHKLANTKYKVLYDDGASFSKMGLPASIPQIVIADQKGIVVHYGGYSRYEKLQAAIEVAQDVPPPPRVRKPRPPRVPTPEPPKEEPKPVEEEQKEEAAPEVIAPEPEPAPEQQGN